MKIAIMQPYFFPHFAYFQLISAVDVYINLDHVSFMKRSYMVRNRIKNDVRIQINVKDGSQNKTCTEVKVDMSHHYIDKFFRTISFLYGDSKNYELILNEIIKPNFKISSKTISEFNIDMIKSICNFLDIKTKIIDSSVGMTDEKRENGLIEIVKQYKSNMYVNSIGGTKLYDKSYFKKFGIDLFFLRSMGVGFIDNDISILDLLFMYDKSFIVDQLNMYELI